MKKRYAVIAGIAIAIPCGGALAQSQNDATAQAAASWATLDANDDGALSPKEVIGTPWEQGFEQMNANGDGKVTQEEFAAHMQDMQREQAAGDSSDS